MLPNMVGFRRLGMLAAVHAVMASGAAHAALTVNVRAVDLTNGGAVLTASGPPSGLGFYNAEGTAGHFSVSVNSEATEGATSLLSTNTIDILNTSVTTQSQLVLYVSVTGYTQPGVDGSILTLSSSASGTSNMYVTGQSATLQSYGDPDNGTILGILPIPVTAVSPGTQDGSIPLSATDPTAAYAFGSETTLNTTFVRNAGPYSISQVFTITLDPGMRANLTLSTSVTGGGQIIPEPSSIALALTALPCLGFLGVRRWRSQNKCV